MLNIKLLCIFININLFFLAFSKVSSLYIISISLYNTHRISLITLRSLYSIFRFTLLWLIFIISINHQIMLLWNFFHFLSAVVSIAEFNGWLLFRVSVSVKKGKVFVWVIDSISLFIYSITSILNHLIESIIILISRHPIIAFLCYPTNLQFFSKRFFLKTLLIRYDYNSRLFIKFRSSFYRTRWFKIASFVVIVIFGILKFYPQWFFLIALCELIAHNLIILNRI